MPTLPVYPQILTQTDWNNKKGVVAKIVAVPTTLGDGLKKLETAYNEVPWGLAFDAPPADLAKVTARLFEFSKQFPSKYTEFTKAVASTKALAKHVKDDWGKNKLIPGSSKTHLDNLIKALDTFVAAADTQSKAAVKVLKDTKDGLAALNPNEAKKVGDTGNVIMGDKTKPKTEEKGFKFTAKAQAQMKEQGEAQRKNQEFNARIDNEIAAKREAAKKAPPAKTGPTTGTPKQ